jgi:pyruvate,water dikinase
VSPVPLREVEQEGRFGGKAAQLGAALRAGFPVPDGVALDVEAVEAIAAGRAEARERCQRALAILDSARVAVRSSAVGEDSAAASFAGMHLTRLNVTAERLIDAVVEVWRSGRTDAVLAYRARLGVEGPPRVAVVVQEMVEPECAGVMFTRNPVDGSDERVIEASWGLGEAVVAGLVTPDRYHLARGGRVTNQVIGDKDLSIELSPEGDTVEREVAPGRRRAPCLDDRRLTMLEELARRIEERFDGAHDVEWAFRGERLYLLQRRAVTR